MDKSERFLAVYQKTNAICISSDSESNPSGYDLYKDVPKLLSEFSYQQKHRENIDKFFEEYLKEKHTEKDVKLLHGVYSNKEMIHENILMPDAQKSVNSNISEDFCISKNESNRFIKINPKQNPLKIEKN